MPKYFRHQSTLSQILKAGDIMGEMMRREQPKIQPAILTGLLTQPKDHEIKVQTVFFPLNMSSPKVYLGWPLAESVYVLSIKTWKFD